MFDSDMFVQPPLLRTPPELLLHVLQHLEIKDVLCLRMACRHLAAFSNQRVVWALIRRKQCLEYRIPFSSYIISKMNATQLERAATTPYLFIQKLLSPDTYSLRERVIDFSATTSRTSDISSLRILDILPGGRFVLAHARQMIMLYDMGHPFSLLDGHRPEVMASKAMPYDFVETRGVSFDNSNYLVCIEAWSQDNGLSTINVLNFSFDNTNRTVTLEEYPHFTPPDPVYALTIPKSGTCILVLAGDNIIKHDLKTGSQVVFELAEELTHNRPHEIWLMASGTTLALAVTDHGISHIVICHLPSTSFSTTTSSPISAAMSISVDSIDEFGTIAEILPASFLTLGYSVHDPDGIMFTCSGAEISLTYRMVDYRPNLPNATRLKFPIPIASHIPLTINDAVSSDCLVDSSIVGIQCHRDEGGNFYIQGSVEHLRPTNVDTLALEAPLHVQIARIHGGRAAKSVQIDAWRGCVYVTLVGEGEVIHVYDLVDPVV